MKIKNYLIVSVGMGALFASVQSGLAQGALTPPGAPAPTMKSLDQIYAQLEPRTPITNTASTVVISQPGSYYLTGNLTVSANTVGIEIFTNGVTLDLNGFTISSTAADNSSAAIIFYTGWSDITIRNGHIVGGVTENGSGVYSGGGFGIGISNNHYNNPLQNVLVSRITVSGCLYDGINLGAGISTVVENCTVQTVGGEGILASTIKSCSALDCGSDAINGDQVSDCRGQSSGSGYGVYATATAQNCYGENDGTGEGLYAYNAQNCYGYGDNGIGLDVYATAQNCFGQSINNKGLRATTADNCYGTSTVDVGLIAITAQSCYGISSFAKGITANTAENCYGQSGGDYAIFCYNAQNCYGYNTGGSGTGIYAYTAENCYGIGGGDGIDASMVQNCSGGSSAYGTGINGVIVLNSWGGSHNGDGIDGLNVQNSYGSASLTGTGINCADGTVSGSYGGSVYGTGLTATIADFCRGVTGSGTQSLNVTHNVNSY